MFVEVYWQGSLQGLILSLYNHTQCWLSTACVWVKWWWLTRECSKMKRTVSDWGGKLQLLLMTVTVNPQLLSCVHITRVSLHVHRVSDAPNDDRLYNECGVRCVWEAPQTHLSPHSLEPMPVNLTDNSNSSLLQRYICRTFGCYTTPLQSLQVSKSHTCTVIFYYLYTKEQTAILKYSFI